MKPLPRRLSREYYYADHMNAILGIYTDLDEFTDLQKFIGNGELEMITIASILGYGDQGEMILSQVLVAQDLYSITHQDSKSPTILLNAKATSSQAWLWHRRSIYLNFVHHQLALKNNFVTGLPN
ncbi:hypothetical protein Tco_0454443 [Tanacetum coccineum]